MRTLLSFALVAALALPATAQHCSAPWDDIDSTDVAAAGLYFVMDSCEPECGPGMNWWIYQESNDFPGLQRGDEVADTTCHGMVKPDTIVF